MPSKYRCFLLVPTDEVVVELRRYAFKDPKCTLVKPRYPGSEDVHYTVHDRTIEIAREVGTIDKDCDGDSTQHTVALDDPRWPTHCACGYEFEIDSAKQEWRTRLFRREDTGDLMTVSSAPVGALYDSGNYRGIDGYQRNGDGMSIVVKTPAGEWLIDGPANNGPGWTRTGTLPNIVVTPSIGIGHPQRMHGWLGGFHGKGDEPGYLCIDMP